MNNKLTKGQERYCQELKKETYPITLQKRIAAFKRSGFREKTTEAIKKRIKAFKQNPIIENRIKELREEKRGAPTLYEPKYCEAVIAFFSRKPFEPFMTKNDKGEPVPATNKAGQPIMIPTELPTKEGFAISIGVHANTLLDWAKKHDDFMCAIRKAENIQKNILIQNGLRGFYEPRFAQFVAKNVTDMKDQTETINRSATVDIPADASAEEAAKIYQDLINQQD